jgi:superfamily II DNA or RNA helicase
MDQKFKNFIIANKIKSLKHLEFLLSKFKLNKSKGDVFELFCFYFFKLQKILDIDKIWLYSKCPLNIIEKLKLPKIDKGIDLIFTTKLQHPRDIKKYHAVQVKYRADRKPLTWDEISTFAGLTFGSADGFYKGILFTNARDVPNEVKNDKYFIYDGDYLDKNMPQKYFENAVRLIDGDNPIGISRRLRDFQRPIVDAATTYFQRWASGGPNGGILALACGTGKTFISYVVNAKQQNKFTIFLVPSLYLLSQTFKEWKTEDRARSMNRLYLLIGSDLDPDLRDFQQQLLITTSEKDIKNFMNIKTTNSKVIISTYQSSSILHNVLNRGWYVPDLIIFDEAHKTCGQVNKEFSLFLNYNFPTIRKLFLTATPSFYEGNNENIISMKNSEVYGEIISSFNVGDAIRAKALTDYKVLISVTEEKQIKDIIAENKWVFDPDLLVKVKSEQLHKAIIIANTIKTYKCKKILTYHKDIKQTIIFQQLLTAVFKLLGTKVTVLQMDGSTRMKNRIQLINKFVSSEISVLCSAQVMNEGVNIPQIDAVCFVDPRKSARDIIQCIGRCLRLYEGKLSSYIIIPELLSSDSDIESDSNFKDIWTVIRALKNQDSEIKDFITDRISGEKSKKSKIEFINTFAKRDINVDEEVNVKKWSEKIMVQICKIADSWEINYSKLKKYVEENEKYPTEYNKDIVFKRLGSWITRQRSAKKGNGNGCLMTQERIKKLESLPNWEWEKDTESIWDKTYNNVEEYIIKTGKYPSTHSDCAEIKKLGTWISKQKRAKKGEKNGYSITKKRVEKLEMLNGWKWEENFEELWYKIYEKVRKYIDDYDRYPSDCDKDNNVKKLANWIACQKQKKNGNIRGTLTPRYIKKLELLPNWKWKEDLEMEWDKTYKKIELYLKTNKEYPSQHNKNKKIALLGKWIVNQKMVKKGKCRGKLTPERIKKLESLSNWQWERDYDQEWNVMYEKVKNYIIENDKYPPSVSKKSEIKKLYNWIRVQQEAKKGKNRGKLTPERIKKLKFLPNWK